MREIEIAPGFDSWRQAARALLVAAVPPADVRWRERRPGEALSTGSDELAVGLLAVEPGAFGVPKAFVDLARSVARHSDPERWALLYRLLWRVVHENHDLLQRPGDPDVAAARELERRVAERPSRLNLLGDPEPAPTSAVAFLPPVRTLEALREAAAACTACPLHRTATQTVFGAGPAEARAMFIGEQPGDQEDLKGQPFVGPAGDVLDRALGDAGIPRGDVYITNAVKHFKWEPRGKRRLHMTPRLPEIQACRPWLEAEIDLIKPALIVCLGATAAQALLGPDFRIMRNRGRVFRTRWAPWLMATIHPSAILRIDDPSAQEQAYGDFVGDLRKVTIQLAATFTPPLQTSARPR